MVVDIFCFYHRPSLIPSAHSMESVCCVNTCENKTHGFRYKISDSMGDDKNKSF